ncbi:hypothetical protein EVAR_103485_1 [Eumeta japonica]|uniref:Uncharacterized protein n=1 Tax=Eumeta variegata TaxID=151549 RepID=A0A4C1ZFP7_EUMVA|nr:hypothetical protein EVAR_103485_1 [Eumeta japonica]
MKFLIHSSAYSLKFPTKSSPPDPLGPPRGHYRVDTLGDTPETSRLNARRINLWSLHLIRRAAARTPQSFKLTLMTHFSDVNCGGCRGRRRGRSQNRTSLFFVARPEAPPSPRAPTPPLINYRPYRSLIKTTVGRRRRRSSVRRRPTAAPRLSSSDFTAAGALSHVAIKNGKRRDRINLNLVQKRNPDLFMTAAARVLLCSSAAIYLGNCLNRPLKGLFMYNYFQIRRSI